MPRHSAGLLLFRRDPDGVRVLLAHMGGPFWAGRDDAAWSFPKGELDGDEDAGVAARREFTEELGLPVPEGDWLPLGDLRVSGGKVITAWAIEAELDVDAVVPGMFDLEWPPRSGRLQQFPEVDRAAWLDLPTAQVKLVKGQRPFLDRLAQALSAGPGGL